MSFAVMSSGGDQHLLRLIISFIIHPIGESSLSFKDVNHDAEKEKHEQACKDLKSNILTSLKVSKSFNQVAWELISPSIPNIISSFELAKLKKNIISIDLSSIEDTFLKEAKSKWRSKEFFVETLEEDYEPESLTVLDVLELEGMKDDVLKEVVARKYKEFLLVKSIEHIATKQRTTASGGSSLLPAAAAAAVLPIDGVSGDSSWLEKCLPYPVVDIFWQAHVLSPRKYTEDCMALVGDIIDHEEGYTSQPKAKPNSDLESKITYLEKGYAEANVIKARPGYPYCPFFSGADHDLD